MSAEVLALVNYYTRAGFHRHVVTVCDEVLKKRVGNSIDPTVAFWNAFGLMMDGKTNEAIRELEGLARRNDMSYPAKLALIHAHQQSRVVDTEEIARLEGQVNGSEEDNASDRARLIAAILLWHLGEFHRSRRQVQFLLRLNPQSVQALTLSGHLALADAEAEIEAGGDANVHFDSAAKLFEQAFAASSRKDLEALMGKVRVHRMREQPKEALDCLNQVSSEGSE